MAETDPADQAKLECGQNPLNLVQYDNIVRNTLTSCDWIEATAYAVTQEPCLAATSVTPDAQRTIHRMTSRDVPITVGASGDSIVLLPGFFLEAIGQYHSGKWDKSAISRLLTAAVDMQQVKSPAGFAFEDLSREHFWLLCRSWRLLELASPTLAQLLHLDANEAWANLEVEIPEPSHLTALKPLCLNEKGRPLPFLYESGTIVQNKSTGPGIDWAVRLKVHKQKADDPSSIVLVWQIKHVANAPDLEKALQFVFQDQAGLREFKGEAELVVFVVLSVGPIAPLFKNRAGRDNDLSRSRRDTQAICVISGQRLLDYLGPTIALIALSCNVNTCPISRLQQLLGGVDAKAAIVRCVTNGRPFENFGALESCLRNFFMRRSTLASAATESGVLETLKAYHDSGILSAWYYK